MATTRMRSAAAGTWRGAGRARRAFRRWRRSRPFWAGLFTVAGGAEILLVPLAPLPILIHAGIAGVSGLLMGILMVVVGLSMWVAPHFRVFAGIATILFALTSFVTSNFGGLLIGMLLGLVGGSLAVAWTYVRPPAQSAPDGGGPAGNDDAGPGGADGDADGGPAGSPSDGPDGRAVDESDAAAPEAAGAAEAAGDGAAGDGAAGGSGEGGPSRLPLAVLGLTALLAGALCAAGTPRAAADGDLPPVNTLVPSMHAERADMTGLSYEGVVLLDHADGGTVRVLKFAMDRVVMQDYSMDAPGAAADGSADGVARLHYTIGTLTLTGTDQRRVEFYTTRMSGLLGGVLPVVFTPDFPPPLVRPETTFTEFDSQQVLVRSDTLQVDGGITTSARSA